jgi:hypothetical protein
VKATSVSASPPVASASSRPVSTGPDNPPIVWASTGSSPGRLPRPQRPCSSPPRGSTQVRPGSSPGGGSRSAPTAPP